MSRTPRDHEPWYESSSYVHPETNNMRCWCAGRVGPREPGDADGLGCLKNIYHDWSSSGEPEFVRTSYTEQPASTEGTTS